jgi:hypothetical protein
VNQVWLPSLENTDFLLDSFVVSADTRAFTVETGLTGWTARIGFNGRSTLWDLAGFSGLSSDTMRDRTPLIVRIVRAPVCVVEGGDAASVSPRRLKTELSLWNTLNLCHFFIAFVHSWELARAEFPYGRNVRVKSNRDQPPPPGNPRAFDLTLPPYRREFDGPAGHLTTWQQLAQQFSLKICVHSSASRVFYFASFR